MELDYKAIVMALPASIAGITPDQSLGFLEWLQQEGPLAISKWEASKVLCSLTKTDKVC